MKKLASGSILFLCYVLFASSLFGQDNFQKTVIEAFKQGEPDKIEPYFTSSIYLELPETKGTHSKNQTKILLKAFFSKHKPTDFILMESGKAIDSQSNYYIGKLSTNTTDYQVYILGKPEQQHIHSISLIEIP
ncbi:MAG: DUF4783 domain-containing protein [Bacteroidetes bacterium]|nr:DUF4783 domain-containing protein [Bacteroidota bacterium]MBU1579735.1 DUF4783 domain-containing protein [Bacteroidota bacterium]MBU2465001.1 DUF4783 domain-containing protein [Bacteroidota bacterium]MBU2556393.1 DUF4783 domain-containing protein [Bacteroidota bacterium]